MNFVVPDYGQAIAADTGWSAAKLEIAVIGGVRVAIGGREISFKSRRSRALLAFLALSDGCSAGRERLCGIFWPDVELGRAQSSLRQIVREVNVAFAAVGFAGLSCGRLALALDPASISLDAWEAVAEARRGQAHPALLAVPQTPEALFADFVDVKGPFRDWLGTRRQMLRQQMVAALGHALGQANLPPVARETLAQAVVNIDPANESGTRTLMQARAELGDAAGALRAYETLCAVLLQQHALPPADATVALRDAIRRGHFDAAAPAIRSIDALAAARQLRVSNLRDNARPPAARSGCLGIAVQDFDTSGLAEGSRPLIAGFRHELIANLVRFREWFIAEASARATAAANAAHYRLDGTAYADGESISVVMTLRSRSTGVFAWSHRARIARAEWQETRSTTIRKVVADLMAQATHERLNTLRAGSLVPREASDHWLLGQSLLRHYSSTYWNAALSEFEAAIRIAPDFSPAYSSIVQMNNIVHLVHPGLMRDPAKLAVALQTARHAAALDPRHSRALLALAWTLANHRRFDEAVLSMRTALDLNPNDFWTLVSVATLAAFNGEIGRARDLARQSLLLSQPPGAAQWSRIGMVRFCAGDDAGAIAALDHVPPSVASVGPWRIAALHHAGQHDAARGAAARFLDVVRKDWFGSRAATDDAVGAWVMQLNPIRHRPSWERLRSGVVASGVPDGGIRFDEL